MAQHAISTVKDDQIIHFFYVRVEYSKSNINDRYRVHAIWDPSVRDFAIVGKTLVYFGINVIGADWGNVYRKPRRLISDQRILALLNFRTCRGYIPLQPLYRPRAAAAVTEIRSLFCARSNFISFTPGFPRAAGRLIRTYYSLGRGRQNCFQEIDFSTRQKEQCPAEENPLTFHLMAPSPPLTSEFPFRKGFQQLTRRALPERFNLEQEEKCRFTRNRSPITPYIYTSFQPILNIIFYLPECRIKEGREAPSFPKSYNYELLLG